ncbi:MAG: indole-3-glycerol phosphate synthase TrpC [Deltaproteobacteria bacterium]|nr:indole-3-glycerol phosphate synthase TrpC [Deltaproteobacteria bacterium]
MAILNQIIERTRADLSVRQAAVPVEALQERAKHQAPPRPFAQALRRSGQITCISEVKRRSPSAGWIRETADAVDVARRYQAGGAAAISVLTDQPFFGGTLDDLVQVKAAVDLPILRKDFMIDPYQVVEARAFGADAILLIVAALPDATISQLLAQAHDLKMDVLVETHDEAEIARALSVGASLIGINHRDLRTFAMDMDLAVRMRSKIPNDRILVAESGLKTSADVARMKAGGIDAVLVGEGLMRQQDPGQALRQLLEAA